jgi:hypothetical protein
MIDRCLLFIVLQTEENFQVSEAELSCMFCTVFQPQILRFILRAYSTNHHSIKLVAIEFPRTLVILPCPILG